MQHRHMNLTRFTPKAEKCRLSGGKRYCGLLPIDCVDDHPSNAATFWNHVTSGPGSQIPAINTSARCANIGT